MKNTKINIFYLGYEHAWSIIPTIQVWRNDFRKFHMGDNYVLALRILNKCIGVNIRIDH